MQEFHWDVSVIGWCLISKEELYKYLASTPRFFFAPSKFAKCLNQNQQLDGCYLVSLFWDVWSRLILKNMFHLLECLGKTMEFVAARWRFQLVGFPTKILTSRWRWPKSRMERWVSFHCGKWDLKTKMVGEMWMFHFKSFSIINHPFWGTPIFGNTHVLEKGWKRKGQDIFFLYAVLQNESSFLNENARHFPFICTCLLPEVWQLLMCHINCSCLPVVGFLHIFFLWSFCMAISANPT